jgi:hypothetical protein
MDIEGTEGVEGEADMAICCQLGGMRRWAWGKRSTSGAQALRVKI